MEHASSVFVYTKTPVKLPFSRVLYQMRNLASGARKSTLCIPRREHNPIEVISAINFASKVNDCFVSARAAQYMDYPSLEG